MASPVLPAPALDKTARHLLLQAQELVVPALRDWATRLPGSLAALAGYHLGWRDEQGRPTAGPPPGKAIRPALAFSCAEAVGGTRADAVGAAVAVELAHNFSLIHDDVIDGDELRRHRPALWAQFGVPAALLGGDALLTQALRVLADTRADEAGRSVCVLAAAVLELIEGEALDTAFERRSDVTVAAYTAMAVGKTGALMGAACALGALAGDADEARAGHLARFGRRIGVAFQITDDLLGVFGDPAVTGKPVGSDLTSRKKTHPVLAAIGSRTTAGDQLAKLYAQADPLDEAQVREAVALVDRAGGRRLSQRAATFELERAFAELSAADPDPTAVADLTALAHLITHRSS
ncbi:polyprenyl synthetase family protein [Streptomyces sp. NBC_01304]|uniref:polyprenyl synthetase family protein n=1 Tax=Streptomyces sp. NBC_01304 TaxID=2903818 RepID=UPI002E112C7A|nr:polyprenyl synthetase family protein [Streptomyces sp. NBC_01304]